MATVATTPKQAAAERTASYTARRRTPLQILQRVLFWALVVFIVFYTLFPFYWAIVSALRVSRDLVATPVTYWPTTIDWSHFRYVLKNGDFLTALWNSVIVAVTTTLLSLALGSLSAYAIGRMKFRGKSVSLYLILSMTMFPQIAILGSLFTMITNAHLYNRLGGLIVAYLTFTLPFTVWVLANFFKAMPGELEEAALVDGATPFQAFWRILLPLAAPGLVTTGLLAFIGAWNEFLYALTFVNDPQHYTSIVAIASFSGNTQYDVPWGNIMAASVVVTIPLVVGVLIFQRKIIGGLTAGAVKG
jgi:trehalose/maltose transport system permease protein